VAGMGWVELCVRLKRERKITFPLSRSNTHLVLSQTHKYTTLSLKHTHTHTHSLQLSISNTQISTLPRFLCSMSPLSHTHRISAGLPSIPLHFSLSLSFSLLCLYLSYSFTILGNIVVLFCHARWSQCSLRLRNICCNQRHNQSNFSSS